MENNQYIEFKQVRNFGDKITVSFEFLRKNFLPLMKAVLYIAGPFGVMTSAAYVLFMGDYMENLSSILQSGEEGYSVSFLTYFVIYISCFVLAMMLLSLTTMEYVNLYIETKGGIIPFGDVWERVSKRVVPSLLISVLLGLLLISFFGFFTIGMFLVFGEGGMVIFMIFLSSLFMYYVMINLAVFFNIFIHENRSVGEIGAIIRRCFFLVKEKWWSTFGLLFIMSLIIFAITTIIQLPLMITKLSDLFSSVADGGQSMEAFYKQSLFEMIYSGITQFAGFLLYVLLILSITFQYFNLVERKESSGLMEQIESIGSTTEESKSVADADKDEDY